MQKAAKIFLIIGLATYFTGLCLGLIDIIGAAAHGDVGVDYFSLALGVAIILCAAFCLTFLIKGKSAKILGAILVALNTLTVAVFVINFLFMRLPQYLEVSLIAKWELYITAILQTVNFTAFFTVISIVSFIVGGICSILAKK